MTVNELISALQDLSSAGLGDRTAYVSLPDSIIRREVASVVFGAVPREVVIMGDVTPWLDKVPTYDARSPYSEK